MDAAIELARAAAEAVGVRDGPTYTQVLVGEDGPDVGELAARLGGGHDAELCEAALGVDLNGLAIAAALGEEIPSGRDCVRERGGGRRVRALPRRRPRAPSRRWTASSGPRRATASSGCACTAEPGDELRPLRRGSDRAGAVLAVGESRKEALARG